MEFRPQQNRNIVNMHPLESISLNSQIISGNDAYSHMPLILGIYTMKLAVIDNHKEIVRSHEDYDLMKQFVDVGMHLTDDVTPLRCYKRAIDIFRQSDDKDDSLAYDLMFVDLEEKLKKKAYHYLEECTKKNQINQIKRNFFDELAKFREEKRIIQIGLESGNYNSEFRKYALYHRNEEALKAARMEIPSDLFDHKMIEIYQTLNEQISQGPNFDDLDLL